MLALVFHLQTGHTILDWLFPPRCVSCGSAGSWFCENCLARIAFISPPICNRCGWPLAAEAISCRECVTHSLRAIDGIRAAAFFEDNPMRPAIHSLKYRNQKVVASILGAILAESYRRYQLSAEVIVPVPLHPSRFRERGYNQSELIARQMGRCLELPVDTRSLQRIRHTRAQMTLGAGERRQNVAEAFACPDHSLAGRRVLLIDDVCTTGSTLDACAVALKERQAASVWGLTLARAR